LLIFDIVPSVFASAKPDSEAAATATTGAAAASRHRRALRAKLAKNCAMVCEMDEATSVREREGYVPQSSTSETQKGAAASPRHSIREPWSMEDVVNPTLAVFGVRLRM
jgi:hypothetical protein